MVFVVVFLYMPVANFNPRLRAYISVVKNWKLVRFRTISGRPICFHLLSSRKQESLLNSLWEWIWLKFFIIWLMFGEILFMPLSKQYIYIYIYICMYWEGHHLWQWSLRTTVCLILHHYGWAIAIDEGWIWIFCCLWQHFLLTQEPQWPNIPWQWPSRQEHQHQLFEQSCLYREDDIYIYIYIYIYMINSLSLFFKNNIPELIYIYIYIYISILWISAFFIQFRNVVF